MTNIDMLVFCAVMAGTWYGVVKNRGSLHLILAHIAAFGACFIVGTAVLILLNPQPSSRGAAFALFALMASAGTLIGTWLWMTARVRQPEHSLRHHLIAGTCSIAAGLVSGVFWLLVLPIRD